MSEDSLHSGAGALGPKDRLIATAGGAVLTTMLRTTRFELINASIYENWTRQRRPAMYVLWHGRLLPCSFYHRHLGLATLISYHRDGDYIARVVESWGYQVLRGSSSRGGTAALRALTRVLREGTPIAVTPDGPRGPRQKMKMGPLLAARLAGVPVIPVSAGTGRAWWFEGWDRFLVPKPFSRIRLAYGDPIEIPADARETELERLGAMIEDQLNALTEITDAG